MKLSVRLTLDGMVRALRWKEHQLAEESGRGYVGAKDDGAGRQRTRSSGSAGREENKNDGGE